MEKRKNFLIHVAYYGVIAAGILLALRFLLSPLMPFIIAFLIAWMLQRPAKWIARKTRLPVRIPALLLTTAFYAIVVTLLLLLSLQVISSLREFLSTLPGLFTYRLLPFIDRSLNDLEIWLRQFDPNIARSIDSAAAELFAYTEQAISNLSSTALKAISSFAAGVPGTVIKVILTVVATFFSALDFDRITSFFTKLLPEQSRGTIQQTFFTSIRSIRKMLISYGLIMIMSFAELSLGFCFMKIPYAVLIAMLVSVFDILPVLGAGGILIPWALIAFIMKDIPLGIGITLLYIAMTIIRNIVEPKLVGKQIGLHPLATLISMIVGLQFFGVIGLFAFPIGLSILVKFRQNSQSHLFRAQSDKA